MYVRILLQIKYLIRVTLIIVIDYYFILLILLYDIIFETLTPVDG